MCLLYKQSLCVPYLSALKSTDPVQAYSDISSRIFIIACAGSKPDTKNSIYIWQAGTVEDESTDVDDVA